MAEKDDMIKMRLPETMTHRWREAAQHSGISLSEWIRDACDVACTKNLDVPALRADLAGFRSDLSRGAGNLLNQIAMKMHIDLKSGHPPTSDHERDLHQALAEISAMRLQLDRALKQLARRRQ